MYMSQFQTEELPILRNSERHSFKTCQQQWEWSWNQGLIPSLERKNARWFGTGIHLALAEWYTPPKGTEKNPKRGFLRGRDPRETWDEFTKMSYREIVPSMADESMEKEFLDAQELGTVMLTRYIAEYGIDPGWEVLIPEQRFSAKIPYNARQKAANKNLPEGLLKLFPNARFITRAVGTFDAPIRNHDHNGLIEIVDHKTAQQNRGSAHLVKDDQIGTYISIGTNYLRAAELIGAKESIAGMIFNYLRKSKGDTDKVVDDKGRVRNNPQKVHYITALQAITGKSEAELKKMTIPGLADLAEENEIVVMGDISKIQPPPLFWREEVMRTRKNRLHQIERIADDAEQMALLRGGVIAPTKNPGDHCGWCDFKELCDVHEDRGDVDQFIQDGFNVRDPYADHRKGAENSKTSVKADKEEKAKAIVRN